MAVTSTDVLSDFDVAKWQGSDSNANSLGLGTKFQAVQEDVVATNADVATLQAEVVVLQAATVSVRAPVIAATTAALPACTYANGTAGVGATLTGNANGALAAQDGVTLTATQRLLVKDQAAPAQNGVYAVTTVGTGGTPFVLTRVTDFDTSAEITDGAYFFVGQGTALGDSAWVMTTNGAITVGTTGIVFVQFSALGQITAGAGLTKTGSTLDVVANADASIVVNASDIQVGVLASDAQHGNRGGGGIHANVIAAGAAGFMTGADKTKLDGIESLADVTDATNVLAALAAGATAKDVGGGAITNVGLVDGRDVSADGTTLDALSSSVSGLTDERAVGIHVPLNGGAVEAGTWVTAANTSSSAKISVSRTPGVGAADGIWFDVPVLHRTDSTTRGFKYTGLKVNYFTSVAAADDIRFEVYRVTFPADGSASAGAVMGGDQNADYNAAYDTAVERCATPGNPTHHTLTVTLSTQAYLAVNEQLAVRVFVDSDAAGLAAVGILGLELLGTELLSA